ncbi:MAG: NUDIX hydrolase [Candidatus Eremiobacteraeota bacterium]|nr:NUDIX hydrolase [Candidatus Eremiobacteraeota bacterium]
MAGRKWEILNSEYVLQSPWYRLRRDACRLPNGTLVEDYYVREHAGFSVIFALTPADQVVFTQQYKHGIGDVVLELPAGMLEPGEDAVICARRELEEETGYVAPRLEHIAEFSTDPTSSTGRLFLFLARDATPEGTAAPDATEDVDTILVPVDRVLDQVRLGHVRAQSHVASIYAALDFLGMLQTRSAQPR